MAAQIINLHVGGGGLTKPSKKAGHGQSYGEWLVPWLQARGEDQHRIAVWAAWPPLETASLKLARLMGQDLKDENEHPAVGSLVSRAILAYRSKRGSGAPSDRAARAYVEVLLECGELLVTNRVEAADRASETGPQVWDPSIGPYDEWRSRLPANYSITNHVIRADAGEYAAGRYMVAAQILSPSEFSRVFYVGRDSSWGPM